MSGATAFDYVLWFVGFALLGVFLFIIVHLVRKRKRNGPIYIGDRYKHCTNDGLIDYLPIQQVQQEKDKVTNERV